MNYANYQASFLFSFYCMLHAHFFYGHLADNHYKFPLLSNLSEINLDNMLKGSAKSFYGIPCLELVRKDIFGKFKPAYMNLDNILIQFNLLNNLYESMDNLHQSLERHNNIIEFSDIEEDMEDDGEAQERVAENIRVVNTTEINRIIEQLRATPIERRERIAQSMQISSNYNQVGKRFVKTFIELQKYVPFEQLVSVLPNHQSKAKFNKFHDSVIFWALSDEHHFKIAFKSSFPVNDALLTSEQIAERLNNLLMSPLDIDRLSDIQAVRCLSVFCNSHRVRSRTSGNPYLIINYDANSFNIEPQEYISPNVDIRRKFKCFRR